MSGIQDEGKEFTVFVKLKEGREVRVGFVTRRALSSESVAERVPAPDEVIGAISKLQFLFGPQIASRSHLED